MQTARTWERTGSLSAVSVVHVEVPDPVHRQAKASAAVQGLTLKAWLEAAMVEKIERENGEERR
jgi:predicted HicB family RNase H-like nuclease